MTRKAFDQAVTATLEEIREQGLWKSERQLVSPQGGRIEVADRGETINLCSNNYLGLADHPAVIEASSAATESHGFGMASVRFICGTSDLHRDLERAIADYLGTEDAISFAACFDANGAVFEPLFGPDDAIVSDTLNHASIIDGIRLCKARRYRFASRDLDDLDTQIQTARTDGAEHVLVVTDGVFSMDGYIADLGAICDLADRHGALVMVDDCHATGVVGPQGRGTPALHDVVERVDIVTSTLGKALGGGMGGFIAARGPVVDLLRQRARPYLFSNALAPGLIGGALAAIELSRDGDQLRDRLHTNAAHFRSELTDAGFTLEGEGHPIIPVMIGDATVAAEFAARLGDHGVYVTAFSFPVVPAGSARVRTQMCAAHTAADVDLCIAAFVEVGREMALIGPAR